MTVDHNGVTEYFSILHRLALVWRPVEVSTGPQMLQNGVVSRLRSFECYCSFWEALQKLSNVGNS